VVDSGGLDISNEKAEMIGLGVHALAEALKWCQRAGTGKTDVNLIILKMMTV